MEPTISLTVRDLILFATFLLVRDGIPFLVRNFFPFLLKRTTDQQEMQNEISKRELELKREIAERDKVMEERQTRSMEAMETYIKDLSAFMAKTYGEVAILTSEARSYFVEGRQAIKQIAVISSKQAKTKKTARH
jgi:hypothetical protein